MVTLDTSDPARPAWIAPEVPWRTLFRFELTVADDLSGRADTDTITVAVEAEPRDDGPVVDEAGDDPVAPAEEPPDAPETPVDPPTNTGPEGGTPDCGNGIIEAGEECDDGNNTDGDGCSVECLIEPEPFCGDGCLDPDEEGDDGNNADGDGGS
ncbi:MAG: DUF4215 domain-containing protein, partial [bacterium]|nr:DUF4215 domain-containing protein [bacterium]